MFVSIISIAIPALFGVTLLAAGKIFKEKVSLLTVGSVLGLSVAVTATYVLSLALPLAPLMLASIMFVLAAATAALVLKTTAWQYWKALPLDRLGTSIAIALFILSALIAPKLLIAKEEGLFTEILNAYGDIAWHMANITAFAEGQSLPPENPILSGTRLTYPFLSNFFSAMLLVGGGSFVGSVVWPAFVLIPLTFIIFYCLARDFAAEKRAALLAVVLFFFSGATFGWTQFGQEFQHSGVSLREFMLQLPVLDFSGNTDNEFNFLSPLLSLLLPQRSFLFGMPIALAILLLLKPTPGEKINELRFITAGVLAGLLPLFHGHTVLAVTPAIIALFILQPGTHWILFVLPALILGLPEVLYYIRGEHTSGSFFRFAPRWMAGETNLMWYWFLNTGLLIPTALVGFFLKAPRALKALAGAGVLMLIIGNVFLFAPWPWDNFKLLVFWLIFSAPLIGWVLSYVLSKKIIPYATSILTLFMVIHALSAALDIYKIILPTARQFQEWDREGIAIAADIRRVTWPQESILTAPYHNSPVVLAGRPRYLGFPGHIWTHGGTYLARENSLKPFFAGTLPVLPEDPPQYVLIGPVERQQFPGLSIRPEWRLLATQGPYQFYAVTPPPASPNH